MIGTSVKSFVELFCLPVISDLKQLFGIVFILVKNNSTVVFLKLSFRWKRDVQI